MSLSDEYKRQFAWRSWPRILDAVPQLAGTTVLDLGCGVGDVAAELVARGARVIGIDTNEELLAEARSRNLPNAKFRSADLREPLEIGAPVDALWCSFAAAYFPDLAAALAGWGRVLAPSGWVALTEIDDLFGHEPLPTRTRALFEAYAQDALMAGRYDFHMGRKLGGHLERAGFMVTQELTVDDCELSFDGPALPDVVEAWRTRLDHMRLLHDFCGPDFESLRDDFLACLQRLDHRSRARVRCCIGVK